MPDHQIQKPNLFISHASSDGQFARILHAEVTKVFADGIQVFSTSSPGAIGPSSDWLTKIEERLDVAQAVIAIITPTSIERPWLWFEVGASWLRARKGQLAIYPLCAPEIDLGALPSPLDRLQALSMSKAIDLRSLFQALIVQFGFGKISAFRASNISKRIPKYKDVKVADIDLNERKLYSGPYIGYSDEGLSQVLITEFFEPEFESHQKYPILHDARENSVYRGKLLHFRRLDEKMDLPPGTSRRLLIPLATRYHLKPDLLTDNIVRFDASDEFKEKILKRS